MQWVQRVLSSSSNKARAIFGLLALVEIFILLGGPDFSHARAEIAEAVSTGKDVPWEADADAGIHIAAWINLALLAIAALTCRWWMRPASPFYWPPEVPRRRWFWPLVILAVMIGTAARVPLASKSLWWDETWVIRQCSHGSWKPDKKNPDELKFSPTTWKRCAFYYQKPTNHVPMSLAQKASLSAWRTMTGAPKHEFSDLAARVPPLTGSAIAIVLLACLLRKWGRPGAGIAAGVLLALHPWHIRYGVDARAYALVVPLCISALFATTCLLESRGRLLRHWIWLGLNQFLWLWAFPNALVDVAVMFILLAWLLVRQENEASNRRAVFLRLFVTHVFSAILLIQVFLPNFTQARRWAGKEADAHGIDQALANETWQQLVTGTIPGDLQLVGFPVEAKYHLFQSHLLFQVISQTVTPVISVIALAGLLVLLLQRRKPGTLVLGILVSGILFAGITWIAKSYFYSRFTIALLVPLVIGLAWTTTLLGLRPWNTAFRSLVIVTALAAWLVVLHPIRRVLFSTPYAPLRDVAEFVEQRTQPSSSLVLCYGLGREALPVYYPQSIGVTSAAEIEVQMQKARLEKRPLYLVQGYNTFNRAIMPDGFRLMDDAKLFEQIAWFPSIDPEFYFRVLKAR